MLPRGHFDRAACAQSGAKSCSCSSRCGGGERATQRAHDSSTSVRRSGCSAGIGSCSAASIASSRPAEMRRDNTHSIKQLLHALAFGRFHVCDPPPLPYIRCARYVPALLCAHYVPESRNRAGT